MDEQANDLDDGFFTLDADVVAAYIVDEITRALEAHERAARGTVQRTLPLGECLALFTLADQFGLIDQVRADLDERIGGNAYLRFSEAMKAALLDRGFGPGGSQAPPRPNQPHDRDARPRTGTDHRPPRTGHPPRGASERG